MLGIIKACRPLDLSIILFVQVFTAYFLGFGNSFASIVDTSHLTIYVSTLFAGIFGHLFLAWSEKSYGLKVIKKNFVLIIAIIASLITITVSYNHSLKMGNIYAIFLIFYLFNALFLKRLPLIGTFAMALISGAGIFVLLPFDPNLKSKLILIYSLYFFGIQFIRESLNDIINSNQHGANGYFTLPVIAGVRASRSVTLFFLFVFILLLTTGVRLIMMHYFTPPLSYIFLAYNIICIGIPLFHLMSRLQVVDDKSEYLYLKNVSTYTMITIGFSMLFF